MKIEKPITLWDKLEQAVINLTDTDDIISVKSMTDKELIDKVIELAYHYRIEYKKLLQHYEDTTWCDYVIEKNK